MTISIIPGATCAVIRIKINGKVNKTLTYWKFSYKKKTASSYTDTETMSCESEKTFSFGTKTWTNTHVYGFGPVFYDLNGLDPNTTYQIKLVVTNSSGTPTGSETSVKEFTTVSPGNFDYGETSFIASDRGTEEDFNELLDWFKSCMIAVGYDYALNQQLSKLPRSDKNVFSTDIYADRDRCRQSGAGGLTLGDTIYLRYTTVNESYDKSAFVHEYRHTLGLGGSGAGSRYHGDVWDYGFSRNRDSQDAQNCSNISRVTGFTRGVDNDEMEIYMFYGENAVDTVYIPEYDGGWRYLGFFLLKALGLNEVNIVY